MRPLAGLLTAFFLLACLGLIIQLEDPFLPKPGRQLKGSNARALEACVGPQGLPSHRTEAYVQDFTASLTAEAREADSDEDVDLVFYGDSIAETWRGTDMGRECRRCRGGPDMFRKFFGFRYRAKIFAVGGDQTAHLQWRFLNGQLLVQSPPKVAVLMIGINDLGAAEGCSNGNATVVTDAVDGLMSRYLWIVSFLRTHTPTTKIILVSLPPRGVWSPASKNFEWPSVFTPAIEKTNTLLRQYVYSASNEYLHYVDCVDQLLPNGQMSEELQGDGLHPTVKGMRILAACILPAVVSVLGPGTRPEAGAVQRPFYIDNLDQMLMEHLNPHEVSQNG